MGLGWSMRPWATAVAGATLRAMPTLCPSRAGVRRVPPPGESALAASFAGADLVDSYAVALPANSEPIDVLAQRALGQPGPVFRLAITLRDKVMAALGVRTSGQMRDRLIRSGADRIDFFRVLSRSSSEIILGEDDRHLDFRLSVLLQPGRDGAAPQLIATTVVRCHGLIGRAYLAAIHIGHVLVVRASLGKAIRR